MNSILMLLTCTITTVTVIVTITLDVVLRIRLSILKLMIPFIGLSGAGCGIFGNPKLHDKVTLLQSSLDVHLW